MPELPEVDAIAGVARKYAAGNVIEKVEILRWNGKYFSSPEGPHLIGGTRIEDVYRVGKRVVMVYAAPIQAYIEVHNAMTGYFDWGHEPWTFDYVEGKRQSTERDVRVRIKFRDGRVLRFHDSRLFGSMQVKLGTPKSLPELLQTPNVMPGVPTLSVDAFVEGILESKKPIKARLMDQDFVPGVGNIYASEACHHARLSPLVAGTELLPIDARVLHHSLIHVISQSIPKVRYDWLKVYRKKVCGTCGYDGVVRVEVKGRATFACPRCQVHP